MEAIYKYLNVNNLDLEDIKESLNIVRTIQKEVFEEGVNIGVKDGENKKIAQIVKNLINLEIKDFNYISKITGISINNLEELINNNFESIEELYNEEELYNGHLLDMVKMDGIKEGIEIGKYRKSVQASLILYNLGKDLNYISDILDITVEDIKHILTKYNKNNGG